MKSLVTLLIAFIAISVNDFYSQNNIAIVNKISGFYIFNDCQPLAEYEVVGEVNTNNHKDNDITNSGGQYQPVRDYLIKTARSVNYTADGLILSLVNGATDKALIIKFKDGQKNKELAKVQQYQGYYVFVDCEPNKQIKYLGTVKLSVSLFSSQYSALRDKLIKKCKTSYPDAKGLVIKFVNGGSDTADAITFE